jgi:hypothetical protein
MKSVKSILSALGLVAEPHPISLGLDAEPDQILRYYFFIFFNLFLYHHIKIIQKHQKY